MERVLYHEILCPYSRTIRLMMTEKRLEFGLKDEPTHERRTPFLAMNPYGDTPVLIDDNNLTVCHADNIAAYLEEKYPDPLLIGEKIEQRIETRRIVHWFHRKFYPEVGAYLADEKIGRRVRKQGTPNGQKIRAGMANIHTHLRYIAYLTDMRNWLAGDHFSLADIAAAAHLSSVDYCGDVPWDEHPEAKQWYMRIKSRKSFRNIMKDMVPGIPPVSHYSALDF